MSDLFHDGFTNEQIAAVFGVMAACPQHVFLVLTKRPRRMLEWFEWIDSNDWDDPPALTLGSAIDAIQDKRLWRKTVGALANHPWPLPNVWLGVSIENQTTAEDRLWPLFQTPAAVRFASAEPLLGPIQLRPMNGPELGGKPVPLDALNREHGWLDWLIVGGESGPGARPMNEDWVRGLRQQCESTGTAFFYKQRVVQGHKVGLPLLDGRRSVEFPEVASNA